MLNYIMRKTPINSVHKVGSSDPHVANVTLYRSLAGALRYLTFTHLGLTYAV